MREKLQEQIGIQEKLRYGYYRDILQQESYAERLKAEIQYKQDEEDYKKGIIKKAPISKVMSVLNEEDSVIKSVRFFDGTEKMTLTKEQ